MALYPTGDIARSFFTHNGQRYRVVQFRGGPLEIYLVEEGSGLELFQGYAPQVNLDLAEAAWDAFQKAPGQRFLFDVASEPVVMLNDRRWA